MNPRLRRALPILVAVAVLLAAVGSYAVLSRGGGHYRVTAYFPRAVSVFESSDVRVLGLPAGTVTAVEVERDRVRVELSIDDSVKIPKDVRAQIIPQSLIGERYIQLSPAYRHGMEAAGDGLVIPVERTITPVEPDEALAAVKTFLDSLDPKNLGRLVSNLEDDLEGNGAALNEMIAGLSEVVDAFADKDEALGRLIESFDRLTASLTTREQQLGEVIDAFATATQVLADERQSIERLVGGLADLSRDGLALVSDHAVDLRADIQTLTDAAAVIDANLSSVDKLLTAGPMLATGLIGAFDPASRSVNLRNQFGPLLPELVEILLGQLGVPTLCLPVLATCGPVEGDAASAPTRAQITSASPVGALLQLLDAPTRPAPSAGPGWWESTGRHVRGAAETLLGVGS